MTTCNACGGSYETVQSDGTHYAHVCPPLSVPEIKAALAEGAPIFDAATQAEYDKARTLDAAAALPDDQLSRVDRLLFSLSIPRPNARNENPPPPATLVDAHAAVDRNLTYTDYWKERNAINQAAILSEGAGVTDHDAGDEGKP